jgi:membrane protein
MSTAWSRAGSASPCARRGGGRGARSPITLPWRGWKDVLARFSARIQEARVLSLAGAVAFFTLLSLVPALSLLVTLYGMLTDPATIVGQLDDVTIVFPQAARELIREQAVRLAGQGHRQSLADLPGQLPSSPSGAPMRR